VHTASSRDRRTRTSPSGAKVSLPQNLRAEPTARHEMLYRVGDELRFDRLKENLVEPVFTLLSLVVQRKKISDLQPSLQFHGEKAPNERGDSARRWRA